MHQPKNNRRRWLFSAVCAALLVTATAIVSLFTGNSLSAGLHSDQLDPKQIATQIGVLSSTATTAMRVHPTVQPTLTPISVITQHVVLASEPLSKIAERYKVTVDALAQANRLQDPNQIRAGQVLTIPIDSSLLATSSAKVSVTLRTPPAPASPIGPTSVLTQSTERKRFTILEGNLADAYPLEKLADGIRIHYQPDSFAANNLEQITRDVTEARALVLKILNVRFDDAFDVYLADIFFEPLNQHLRGRTFAPRGQVFVLFDGSGTPAERRYMLAHEFTHLIAWRSFGRPGSTMISEGLAVYVGQSFLQAEGFISLTEFCLAYRREKRLPLVSSRFTTYLGHLYSLDAYYAAGCFIQNLAEAYSIEKVGMVYSNLAFEKVYGKSLKALEGEWLSALDKDKHVLSFGDVELATTYESLLVEYRAFFENIAAGRIDEASYHRLDVKRISILKGNF